jgi:hypothetical protein
MRFCSACVVTVLTTPIMVHYLWSGPARLAPYPSRRLPIETDGGKGMRRSEGVTIQRFIAWCVTDRSFRVLWTGPSTSAVRGGGGYISTTNECGEETRFYI